MEWLTWIGIGLCVMHSAMFSGLNLALFGVSRLRLEIEASSNNPAALRVLGLRQDSNFLLASILWGNVGFNCLLTLLSDSVMAGVAGFVFSTFVITFFGEIFPQAYFSRHALKMGALLAPVLKFYQKVLYPFAKPTALVLDRTIGREGIEYFREMDLRKIIKRHVDSDEADLEHFEGVGALNILTLDDLPVSQEGENVDPSSLIRLPVKLDLPVIPPFEPRRDDPFLAQVNASGRKWVVLANESDEPLLVLDADGFLRAVFLEPAPVDAYRFCHRPLVVDDGATPIGSIVGELRVHPQDAEDDVIDHDLVLLWGDERRIVTGADLLGRILRGIVPRGR